MDTDYITLKLHDYILELKRAESTFVARLDDKIIIACWE